MPRMDKLSGYKTTICTRDGTTEVVYHSTVVVAFNDREIVLDTGGYKTVTTKRKMNQAANQFDLPYSVYQKRGQWYVDHAGTTVEFHGRTHTILRA